MAYGIPEFPGTNEHDWDLHELIRLYIKLKKEYDAILRNVEDLQNKWAQIDAKINKAVEDAVNRQIFFVNQQICALQNRLNYFEKKIVEMVEDERKAREEDVKKIWQEMCACYKELKELDRVTNQRIDFLTREVEKKVIAAKAYALEKMIELDIKYRKEVQRLEGEIAGLNGSSAPVHDVVDGETESVGDVIKKLWNRVLNLHGFTAEEWTNATYIDCEYWNRIGISAENFYTHGKVMLMWYYDDTHVWSYLTGKQVPLTTAIYELYQAVKQHSLTAKEYDDKQLTASTYDEKNVSAGDYDLKGLV